MCKESAHVDAVCSGWTTNFAGGGEPHSLLIFFYEEQHLITYQTSGVVRPPCCPWGVGCWDGRSNASTVYVYSVLLSLLDLCEK